MTTQRGPFEWPLFAPYLPALLEPLLRREEIDRARAAAEVADQRLDLALRQLGVMSDAAMREVLRDGFGVNDTPAAEMPGEPILVEQLRPAFLAHTGVLPLRVADGLLTLGMLDPFDDFTANAIALKIGCRVSRQGLTVAQLQMALAAIYRFEVPATDDHATATDARGDDVEMLRDAASDAPVIRLVNELLLSASRQGASDIHLRPGQSGPISQFRINGELVLQQPPPAALYPSLVSRLKILANLDISERRLPQDGTIRTSIVGRPVDIRISTMPHLLGEAAVLRLLARDLAASRLADLGFSPVIEAGLERLFTASDGLILVTGPTGSGKSTTLHAGLHQLIRPGLNIVTIEDPVEYRIEGIAQIQVDEKIGLSFSRALRSLLRQDPDIILVGEIRDTETARIAIQAALTGHLVLATLHTNSAPAAVPRLIDMGIEPYLLAAVLRGVLAQRLVRARAGATRVAIGELLVTNADLTTLLAVPGNPIERRAALAAAGYRPLLDDAEARIASGEIERRDLLGLVDAG